MATVVAEASYRGKQIQKVGEPCGWHERKQARRRGTNAKEEARFPSGEWIDPTARSTLTATHLPGTSQPWHSHILRAYVSVTLITCCPNWQMARKYSHCSTRSRGTRRESTIVCANIEPRHGCMYEARPRLYVASKYFRRAETRKHTVSPERPIRCDIVRYPPERTALDE